MPSASFAGCATPATRTAPAFSAAPILLPMPLPCPGTPRLNEPTSSRKSFRYCVPIGSPVKGNVVQNEPGGAPAARSTSQAILLPAGGDMKFLTLVLHNPPEWQLVHCRAKCERPALMSVTGTPPPIWLLL